LKVTRSLLSVGVQFLERRGVSGFPELKGISLSVSVTFVHVKPFKDF